LAGELGSLRSDDLLDGAARDHTLDAVLYDAAEAPGGDVFDSARRLVVLRDVVDPPLDVEVDAQDLAFARQKLFGRVVVRDDAALELTNDIHERHLDVQAGRVVGAHDLPEAEFDREL